MTDAKLIDTEQMINRASQIAENANEMQNAIKGAFQKIQSMSENWFGQSYDNFIDVVNTSIIALNKLFEISVSDIPHEISSKAQSYAHSNQQPMPAGLREQIALILSELPKTNKGAKLRFRSSEVAADQSAIKSKFEEAKSCADKASTVATSLESDWQSVSGDNNIRELKEAFKRVKNIVSHLQESLDSQISAQENTISTIENAANAVVASKEVVENAVESTQQAASNAINAIKQSSAEVWTNLTGKN